MSAQKPRFAGDEMCIVRSKPKVKEAPSSLASLQSRAEGATYLCAFALPLKGSEA